MPESLGHLDARYQPASGENRDVDFTTAADINPHLWSNGSLLTHTSVRRYVQHGDPKQWGQKLHERMAIPDDANAGLSANL